MSALDHLDHIEMALQPFRAVEQLTAVCKLVSEQDLPLLRRDDFSALTRVLTDHMQAEINKARVAYAQNPQPAAFEMPLKNAKSKKMHQHG